MVNTISCIELPRILRSAGDHSSKFIFSSTTGIYGIHNDCDYPLSEEACSIISPSSVSQIYNISKLSAEQIISNLSARSSSRFYSLRLNINYGPGINLMDGRALSDFIMDGLAGRSISLKTDGAQSRNYLYLSDTISAIILLISKVDHSCTVNISNPEEITIAELAGRIALFFNVGVQFPSSSIRHSGIDFNRTSVDISLLQSMTDWKPLVCFDRGIEKLVSSLEGYPSIPELLNSKGLLR